MTLSQGLDQTYWLVKKNTRLSQGPVETYKKINKQYPHLNWPREFPQNPNFSFIHLLSTVLLMAYESSRSIIRQKIHEAGQCFFNYELETEDKIAILTKFRDLDDDGDGKISFRELRNLRRTMDPALADSICSLFELADRDGNGVLDLDECKALIFLIINRSCCCLCKNLILRDGVSCLDCSPVYFDLCFYCFFLTIAIAAATTAFETFHPWLVPAARSSSHPSIES